MGLPFAYGLSRNGLDLHKDFQVAGIVPQLSKTIFDDPFEGNHFDEKTSGAIRVRTSSNSSLSLPFEAFTNLQ